MCIGCSMCDQLVARWLWPARVPGTSSSAGELPYSFRHALFRQVLYERTPPSVRAQLHRKVGVALERERAAGLPVAATELALHFERGRELTTAARCYAEAAESALLRLARRRRSASRSEEWRFFQRLRPVASARSLR